LSAEESRVLAEEQAALRRVATLVARGVPPAEVFAAVTEEAGRLLSVEYATLGRYESDGTLSILVAWSRTGVVAPPVGSQQILGGNNLSTLVFETGRPARIDSYADASGPLGVAARKEGAGSGVGTPIIVEGRLWGLMTARSKRDEPLPADTEVRLANFTELLATAIANAAGRAELARLAEEQAALRRVATLVARGVPPEEVFAAVAEEVGRLMSIDGTRILRYEADDTATVISGWSEQVEVPPELEIGARVPLDGESVSALVFRTGQPARVDNYANVTGPLSPVLRKTRVESAVGAPIVVEGRLWGVIAAGSLQGKPLPLGTEERLAAFTELVATAIANAESRAALGVLADEQAALRRVATLVARGTSPTAVFAVVAKEVGRLVSIDGARILRYETDGTATVISVWSDAAAIPTELEAGSRLTLDGESVAALVLRTGRPARIDSYANAHGSIAVRMGQHGFRSAAGAPIVVDGLLWGVMAAVSSQAEPLPVGLESRIAQFTELVATAIANAESRAALAASRARIVAAADETRRRIERDLHDGTQQRLVSLGLELRAAQAAVPPQLGELQRELSRVAEGLASVFDELREISHGIHPAILSEGGLEPALKALCRRSALPVELDVHARRRLPEPVEVAAYYVVSEALTNTAKHAQASVVHVELATVDAILRLAIRDDGIGGADPVQGSGLVGLSDRIEALGGTLQVTSPAGNGTTLLIEIPLEGRSSAVSPEP